MRALPFVLLATFSLTAPTYANNRAQPDGWIGAIAHFQPTASGYTAVNSYLANSLASLVYRISQVFRKISKPPGVFLHILAGIQAGIWR